MHPEAEKIVEKFINEQKLRIVEKTTAKTKAADVLAVLDARKRAVSDAQRERILGCTDLEKLALWLRLAVTVDTTDELFV